jgi:hypothetical protein
MKVKFTFVALDFHTLHMGSMDRSSNIACIISRFPTAYNHGSQEAAGNPLPSEWQD